ncbi:hypothetical protein K9B35_03665 [Sphingomonas sp. R647]|uniref:hypothetical protein n=1 Tax=Sphingomonas sp. R647 TaxID=2875233 RepID=UPI001CD23D3B|nr:hypothetical protein [Sphingomonas sp. R647]MCA1197054.1 hypothetical protein [Sphingomonas sp. R647]
MSPFELVFAVYGLLLGLAIAEVLGGFARVLKLKRGGKAVRVGWLTPLLGIVVILDLTSFWLLAWEAQSQIVANYLTLVSVLAIVGIYYLAASLIFPDEPADWPDFDLWYDRQNRMVLGGLLAANVGSWIGSIALEFVAPSPEETFSGTGDVVEVLAALGVLILLLVLLRVSGRRANALMLAAVSLLLLTAGIAEVF